MKRPPSPVVVGWAAALALGLAALGCAPSSVRHAEAGDLVALRAELAEKHRRGALTNGEARDVARALLAREIEGLTPPAGVAKVARLRMCASELVGPLDRRAARRDEVGAAAARLLLEEGLMSPGAAGAFTSAPEPAYRALASRALVEEEDAAARQAALLAPTSVTRELAALAAGDGAALAELDALFEAARVDPEPSVRHLALRAALGAVARRRRLVLEGREAGASAKERAATEAAKQALDRLRDAWTVADKGLRDDVASGFAVTPLYELGGREALRNRLAEEGPDRLLLASAILRGAASRDEAEDQHLRSAASRAAVGALREGSTLERTFAVALVALDPEGVDALREASRDADREVALSALGRLLRVPAEADRARVELVRAAGKKDEPRLAPRARGLLAGAGYLPVQLWLEEQAAGGDASLRLRAAAGLAALGRVARAAPLLTDPDPEVRARSACLVLAATR